MMGYLQQKIVVRFYRSNLGGITSAHYAPLELQHDFSYGSATNILALPELVGSFKVGFGNIESKNKEQIKKIKDLLYRLLVGRKIDIYQTAPEEHKVGRNDCIGRTKGASGNAKQRGEAICATKRMTEKQ